MNDIMKIIKSLEESGFFIKGANETIKNEPKEQKGGFLDMLEESGFFIKVANKTIKNEAREQKGGSLDMLLGTLGASLLGNLLTGIGTVTAGEGTIRAGIGTVRAGQDF